MAEPSLYVGLMTGTSVDAIDAVLLETQGTQFRILDAESFGLPSTLKHDILALFEPGANEIERSCAVDRELAEHLARAVTELISRSELEACDIRAIGSHGQTLRHRPYGNKFGPPFSLQVGDPNTIAAQTGITTVADFRRKDIALGGQGAPLAPIFHRQLLKQAGEDISACAVLNLGGIANLSLTHDEDWIGFDSGPGNALLDAWVCEKQGHAFDKNGEWAASGRVLPGLLSALLTHDYFAQANPKSTGRETFTLQWLKTTLSGDEAPEDVQATLAALTAQSIAEALAAHKQVSKVYVCGGGVHNRALMRELAQRSGKARFQSIASLGMDPDFIEAACFAWLAHLSLAGLSGNLPAVTGASRSAILGAIYAP